jgi:SAM-dependent methyltransferase
MRELTYDLDLLLGSMEAWRRSAALRAFYQSLYGELMTFSSSGQTLELGSGIGSLREFFPEVVLSDVALTPFVDQAVSAYDIQASGRSWDNVVAIDVLHHLCHPWEFFASASAALHPGGRVLLAEPASTIWGRRFYRLCHHEPCLPDKIDAKAEFVPDPITGEYANMGMGWALFARDRKQTEERLRSLEMRLVAVRWRDFAAYPATGGFSRPAFLPSAVIKGLLACERLVPQQVMKFLALRMLIVVEKTSEKTIS